MFEVREGLDRALRNPKGTCANIHREVILEMAVMQEDYTSNTRTQRLQHFHRAVQSIEPAPQSPLDPITNSHAVHHLQATQRIYDHIVHRMHFNLPEWTVVPIKLQCPLAGPVIRVPVLCECIYQEERAGPTGCEA